MLDNDVSEIVDQINENTNKIIDLKKELELSETRRETAEKMLSDIKQSLSSELQEAYKSGYNAALTGTNPEGGTTITNENDKTLVLTNQN